MQGMCFYSLIEPDENKEFFVKKQKQKTGEVSEKASNVVGITQMWVIRCVFRD